MKVNSILSSKSYRDSARKNAIMIKRASELTRIHQKHRKAGSAEKELTMLAKKTA